MKRMILSLITLTAFVNCLVGCTSTSVVVMPRDELLENHKERDVILDARLQTDSIVYFDKGTATLDDASRVVIGYSRNNSPVVLNYDEISAFRVERFSTTNSVLLTAGVAGVVAAVVLLSTLMEFGPCIFCGEQE